MNRSILCKISVFLLILVVGCSPFPDQHWSGGLPDYTPAVVVTKSTSNFNDILYSEYMEFLDATTPSQRSVILEMVHQAPAGDFNVKAIALFPHSADQWMPVWIAEADKGLISAASKHFSKPFTESSYQFNKAVIHKLFMQNETILYGVQLRRWLYVSESSFAIEEIVRAYGGRIPSLEIDPARATEESFIVNGGHIDRFVAQETAVRYRPLLSGAFRGAGIAYLEVSKPGGNSVETPLFTFDGSMSLAARENRSSLVRALSTQNHGNILDRYISQDAALAVLMNGRTETSLPQNATSQLDSDVWFTQNPDIFTQMARALGDNFAYSAFASSGFLSVGEYAFLRLLEDRAAFVRGLQALAERDDVTQDGESYFIQSAYLSSAISNNMSNFDAFYLRVIGDAIVITQRPGLAQKLASDRSRRRVLYFNENYLKVRQSFPDQISGFVFSQSEELTKYVQSLLNPVHNVDVVTDRFDLAAMAFRLSSDGQSLNWSTNTYQVQRTTQPFEERWLVSLDGTELSGPPVLANIGGSPRDEVIAATQGGLVVGLAADGTQVFRVRTGTDTPTGPPIVYDWYANNQMAIIIGAGNKIYAWNNTGSPLPNFPIVLSEPLSAPIRVVDVTRNGLPEIIAATVDRRIHVLDQRGNNINGWPQSVNASIRSIPIVETLDGRRSVFAYAENVIFGWDPNGNVRPGFPVFSNAPLRGDIFMHRNHIIAGSADGNIVAIGRGDYFSDEYGLIVSPPSLSDTDAKIQAVQIANSPVVVRPFVTPHSITLPDESTVNEPLLFATADNGSIYAIAVSGALRFTQSLGQPSMSNHPPMVVDLNRNSQDEIIGLAGFGRLYAWSLQSGERFLALPTTALKHPITGDINGNGRNELIAGSQEGIRAWTINR
jgi:hypothetical protein